MPWQARHSSRFGQLVQADPNKGEGNEDARIKAKAMKPARARAACEAFALSLQPFLPPSSFLLDPPSFPGYPGLPCPCHPLRTPGPRRQLTLLDSTSIIVGIIIGAAIYESSPKIAGCVPNAWWLMGVWVLGGVLALVGALCYAELATAYPQDGG